MSAASASNEIAASDDVRAETPADVTHAAQPTHRGLLSIYLELSKARLSALVLLTTAVGFVLAAQNAAPPRGIDWLLLTLTVLGAALSAGSANTFNQIIEISRDRRMIRTQNRPLPSGAISTFHAFFAAVFMGYAGIAILAIFVNLFAAALALLTIIIYAALYTPLKPRSTLNTIVGAICGAIPPMIGWVAATGSLAPGAWVLAAILFVWQLPHFFALAWLYRDDYARGGFRMLPLFDPRGELTGRIIVLTSMMLVPLALIGVIVGLAGLVFAAGSLVLGLWLLALAWRFYITRSAASARGVFIASIIYLSALFLLFVADRGPVHGNRAYADGMATPIAAIEPAQIHREDRGERGEEREKETTDEHG